MKTERSFIAACCLLITQLMVITARPTFNRRIARMKRKTIEETPIVVLTRTVPSKESHIDEEGNRRVDLAKLLGLHDVDTSAIKQKPDAFSADLTNLSYELKLQSDVNTKKTSRGKKRVRRQRCYPPFWQCSIQPTSSKRKQVLPERHNMNL